MTTRESPPLRPRRSRSFKSVAVGFAALGLVIVAIALSLYVRFIRYERVAVRHVPSGTALAIRLEVEQAAVYAPVRRHLLPLLGGPSSSPAEREARLLRFEARTHLHRGDLREVVVGWGTDPSTWVVILGGIFPKSGLALLAEALRAESPAWASTADGAAVVEHGAGIAVGRGRDGTVIIASSADELRASLEPKTAYDSLGLLPAGAGSIAATEDGLRALASLPRLEGLGDLRTALATLRTATGSLTLGDRLTLKIRGEALATGAASRGAALGLSAMKGLGRTRHTALAGVLRAVADRATVAYPDGRSAVVALVWEHEEVDEVASSTAQAIERAFP